MKYYVRYVEGCTPMVKEFKTEEKMFAFVKKFIKKYGGIDDGADNWVDDVYYGDRFSPQLVVEAIAQFKQSK